MEERLARRAIEKELPLVMVVAPEENINCKAMIGKTQFHIAVFDGKRGRIRDRPSVGRGSTSTKSADSDSEL
jgi:hypothetical protein